MIIPINFMIHIGEFYHVQKNGNNLYVSSMNLSMAPCAAVFETILSDNFTLVTHRIHKRLKNFGQKNLNV